jgi:hypothetical protein
MYLKILFSSVLLLQNYSAFEQALSDTAIPSKRGQYALVATVGMGISVYPNQVGTPPGLDASVNKTSFIGTIRLMWKPDHLLQIGLESGWLNFYRYTFQDSVSGSVSVRAVPLIVVFSMPAGKNINLFAGPAYYFIQSKLDYHGISTGSSNSLGWMAAVSYIYHFRKDCGIGAEIKWMNAYVSEDASFSLQIQFIWNFLKW